VHVNPVEVQSRLSRDMKAITRITNRASRVTMINWIWMAATAEEDEKGAKNGWALTKFMWAACGVVGSSGRR